MQLDRFSDPNVSGIAEKYFTVLVNLEFNLHSHQVDVVYQF